MRSTWLRRSLFVIAGGAAGFAYYWYVGCASGTCPISSNPYISTAYGGLLGFVLSTGKNKVTPPA